MQKAALYIHLILLCLAAASLVYIYFIDTQCTDWMTQATFWLVIVSSILGIINYNQISKRKQS